MRSAIVILQLSRDVVVLARAVLGQGCEALTGRDRKSSSVTSVSIVDRSTPSFWRPRPGVKKTRVIAL